MPAFAADVNLPHSRTILARLSQTLDAQGILDGEDGPVVTDLMRALEGLLSPFDDDPADDVSAAVASSAAMLARVVGERLRDGGVFESQVGRHVRNLFECLGRGDEGATLALELGEDPGSPLRPVGAH